MRIVESILKCIHNPLEIGRSFMEHTAQFWTNDKMYLRLLLYFKMGYRLNLDNPQTFNEKLQWLKLYNHDITYCSLVDKFKVKDYVKSILGEEMIIPTLGVWETPDDIEWAKLPDKFVLKTTNGGGGSGVILCRNKSLLDKKEAVDKLNRSMNSNIYTISREWPYKGMKSRIIAEALLENENGGDVRDYKFYCFDGIPKVMLIASERFKRSHSFFDYYDMEGNHLPFTQGGDNNPEMPAVPDNFEELKNIAQKLSSGFPHVRIDLYSVNGRIYFGEYTFFDSCGFEKFNPFEWDYKMGQYLKLPNKQ